MNKKLILSALVFALGETAYILLVALLMINGQKFFGPNPAFLSIMLFLLLLVLSAAVSGALILGKPVLLYLDGKKKEAIELFGFTLGWLLVFLIIILTILAIYKK